MLAPERKKGFLTGIVKRIRESSPDPGDSQSGSEATAENSQSVREQRRRDNAVRKREFNYLRHIRTLQSEHGAGPSIRPSMFHGNSMFDADVQSVRGRARTVRKIDAIEAELAQQWWSSNDTVMPDTHATRPGFSVPILPLRDALAAGLDLFKQGQYQQAEKALVDLLQLPQLDVPTALACSTALLDVYRAMGARDSFDLLAVEYAQLFGRSAPNWLTPDLVAAPPIALDAAVTTPLRHVWRCPARLGAADTVQMQALAQESEAITFDWSAIDTVDSEAAQGLLNVFNLWARRPIVLRFEGVEMLQHVLAARTPTGKPEIHKIWWRLRFQVLRVLHAQTGFNVASIAYSATYGVSPPAWTAPRCRLAH